MKKSKKLEIKSLGRFEIYCDNDMIMSNLSSKAAGLLCFLSMCPEMSASRDQLSSLFWDDEAGDAAKYNLRFTTWQIKKLFSEQYNVENIIYNDKNIIRLSSNLRVDSDAMKLKQLYKKALSTSDPVPIYEAIKELYSGDFLENYEFKNCFKFNDWIFYEKEDLQRIYFDVLIHLAEHYKSTNKNQAAIDIYREMLRMNPFIEESHVMLIRAYLKIGDRSSAITQYERCSSLLRDELNVAPMESTRKVYEEIISGENKSIENAERKIVSQDDKKTDNYIVYIDTTVFRIASSQCGISIMTSCLPNSIEYYWIWSFLEGLFDVFDIVTLKKISEKYWQDASIYNSRICEEMDLESSGSSHLNSDAIRTFSSLYSIIKALSKVSSINIFVENENLMDDSSNKFYQMLKNNLKTINVILHVSRAS